VIKSRRMRLAVHGEQMEMRNVYKILEQKPSGMRQLGRP
jgi:hypothetical protein